MVLATADTADLFLDTGPASAGLPSKQKDEAMVVGKDLEDFIAQIDYQKYFDAMGQPGTRGGAQEAAFAQYSLQAVTASQKKLAELLALMPRDELAAAQKQAGVTPF